MRHLSLPQKSVLYASKTLLGSMLCWWLLAQAGIENPIWSVITVMLVSDPDLTTTRGLVYARVINTIVGCSVGLIALLVFGYSMLTAIIAASLVVLLVTSIGGYPNNWRLAPATVIILMDAGRLASSHQEEIRYAVLRAGEIGMGCAVALVLAVIYTRLFAPRAGSVAGE